MHIHTPRRCIRRRWESLISRLSSQGAGGVCMIDERETASLLSCRFNSHSARRIIPLRTGRPADRAFCFLHSTYNGLQWTRVVQLINYVTYIYIYIYISASKQQKPPCSLSSNEISAVKTNALSLNTARRV